MRHFALPRFWKHYRKLPTHVQKLADEKFKLLKGNPDHPSLHLNICWMVQYESPC